MWMSSHGTLRITCSNGLFDVAFAAFGLIVLAPLVVLIAIAIKLDSPGPVFYTQDRTAVFGETFAGV